MKSDIETNANLLSLRDFVESNPADAAIAPPLVHVSDGTTLASALQDGKLDPDKANLIEDERAIYLFVGKPAYKLKAKAQCEYWEAPVVFIFSNDAYSHLDRLTAFDSGGLLNGKYLSILGSRRIEDFEIPSNASSASAVISAFFGDRKAYLASSALSKEEMRTKFNLLPSAFKILALAALYNAPRTNDMDDRKSTLEARTRSPLPLDSTLLKGIVLPTEWLTDPLVDKALKSIGCIVRDYEIYPVDREHYTSELYRSTMSIMKEMEDRSKAEGV